MEVQLHAVVHRRSVGTTAWAVVGFLPAGLVECLSEAAAVMVVKDVQVQVHDDELRGFAKIVSLFPIRVRNRRYYSELPRFGHRWLQQSFQQLQLV